MRTVPAGGPTSPCNRPAASGAPLKGSVGRKPEKKYERRMNMPAFGTPFSGLSNDRKLTDKELVRAIRFMVAAEYEATQLYMQLAESTDNQLAVEVLKDIADEERVHAGEFLKLLYALAPDEEGLYSKGAGEVAEIAKSQVLQTTT